VISVLVAVAVSMAVVVARGGGEHGRSAATAGTRSVATPAARLIGPSAGRWKSGVRPLLGAKAGSQSVATNCPKHAKSRPWPADFPTSFPFPKGMVLTDVRRYAMQGARPVVYVIGVAPLSLQGAARFFIRELPLHAYYITSSEAEPIEIEARFNGPAKGALKVVRLPQCSSAVWMLVGISTPRR
jgi:hypothetical protein